MHQWQNLRRAFMSLWRGRAADSPAEDPRRPDSGAAPPIAPLLFIHIQKTAGCSIRNLLCNRFPVAGTLLDAHHVDRQQVDPSNYQFVTGHLGFDYVARFARRPCVLTFLRRPLDRALSAYSFFRSNRPPFLQWLRDTLPPRLSEQRVRFTAQANALPFLEFLRREEPVARAWLGNLQTRCLAGRLHASEPCPEAKLLAEAKRQLEACDVIGLTERLADSVQLLEQRLGWEGLGPIPHDNPTEGRVAAAEIDPDVRTILTAWNQLDAELYEFAAELFERRVQAMNGSPPQRSSRREAQARHLPDAADFAFDQPIHGHGWSLREQQGGRWFCWMGREAWIDLRMAGEGPHTLQCRIAHVAGPTVLNGLRVRVNGECLNLRRRVEGPEVLVEAQVPAQAVDAHQGWARITFGVEETIRPQDLVPGHADPRSLGIALAGIRFLPAAQDFIQPDSRDGVAA